ncbi:DUF3168 domain-containing protein [Cytobacillus sp. FSL R5-0569]|uniref:tail completion protein gp17 n=1 Tax=Cytobacillus sp. FSL R5-0569 TaxID=2921649 RepID=UPI0030FD1D9C
MEILDKVYRHLIEDDFIITHVKGRIKFYEYPETGDVTNPFIVLQPLDVPTPSTLADNTYLSYDFLLQVEVWSKDRKQTEQIAKRVGNILWDIGFIQNGGINEYDEKIYRDARRYRGNLYRDDLDTIN